MKNMKKGLTIVLTLIMVLTMLAGCGQKTDTASTGTQAPASSGDAAGGTAASSGAAKQEKQIHIGVSMQGNQSGFIQYITSGIWEWQKNNAPDIKLDVVFADDDAARQYSQIETFVANKVDAIIINPVDKMQSAAAVDLAADNKIPIITVNTTTDSTRNAAHVGSDDVEAGRLQMDRLIEVCGPNAKVAYVDAVLGHSAQVGRAEGYKQSMEKNAGVKLVVHDTGNWSADESMKLVENWIQSGKEIDAIACMADCQLIGVITAINNANKIGKIKLAGMDCDPVVMEAIENGSVDNSIWQDGVGQGENAIRLAYEAAQGKKVSDYLIPFEVCHKGNIAHYKDLAKVRDALAKKYF